MPSICWRLQQDLSGPCPWFSCSHIQEFLGGISNGIMIYMELLTFSSLWENKAKQINTFISSLLQFLSHDWVFTGAFSQEDTSGCLAQQPKPLCPLMGGLRGKALWPTNVSCSTLFSSKTLTSLWSGLQLPSTAMQNWYPCLSFNPPPFTAVAPPYPMGSSLSSKLSMSISAQGDSTPQPPDNGQVTKVWPTNFPLPWKYDPSLGTNSRPLELLEK